MRLGGDRLGDHRLAHPRRSDQQHPLGQPCAEMAVALRVFEEVYDLFELLFDVADAADIVEGHVGDDRLDAIGGLIL